MQTVPMRGDEAAQTRDFIQSLCGEFQKHNYIDPSYYEHIDVKRGLRNADGTGVMAGITQIGNVQGYYIQDGERVPMEGRLIYRGISIEDLIHGFMSEGRFGFEETAYLLLLGRLPNAQELASFQEQLSYYRSLPNNFVRDVILKAPSHDIMNSLARSVLNLASYDDRCDDISLPNVMRQCVLLTALFPMLSVYGYQAYIYKSGSSLFFHAPRP